jgi:hypothetical protein
MVPPQNLTRGWRGRDRMVVEFITTYAISVYHHYYCEFEPRSWRVVLNTTLCDKFVSDLRQVGGFSPSTPVSSTSKTKINK